MPLHTTPPLTEVERVAAKLGALGAIRELALQAIRNPSRDVDATFKEIERMAKRGRRL
jgi:hypothetical protein